MLPLPKVTSIIGAVGADENGKRVTEACSAAGIVPMFYEQETDSTGCVAKLSVDAGPAGSSVTQITHLSAGNAYSKQRHLDLGKCRAANIKTGNVKLFRAELGARQRGRILLYPGSLFNRYAAQN